METFRSSGYEVVPTARVHAESLHACYDTVARERRYITRLEAPALERMQNALSSYNTDHEALFVATLDNQVVGWCDIRRNLSPGFMHCGYLGMGVHPNHRRRGVGSALLDTAIKGALSMGLERIELHVFSSNSAAINLYKKHGFAIEGIHRRARKLDEEYDDVLSMASFLQETSV